MILSPNEGEANLVNLSCIDDDAQGEALSVLWEHELDGRGITRFGVLRIAEKDLDDPELFAPTCEHYLGIA